MVNEVHEEYVRRFPPAKKTYDENDPSFAARLYRLKKQTQGSEPFVFDQVTEHVFTPEEGQMFIDNSIVEKDGKLWNFHIVGKPEDLEQADPRIRKLKYEFGGYSTASTLFDFRYQGHVQHAPLEPWEIIATWCPAHVIPYKEGFISVYTAVGIEGTRIGAAYSDNLLDWKPHPGNPLIHPPLWAEQFGACKDVHVLHHGDTWFIYYSVKSLEGYPSVALATTKDFQSFDYADQASYQDSYSMRGTGGVESSCIIERNGLFHLFYCCGQGTWHTISDNPYRWHPETGKYLMGPFVAAEFFEWNGEWWMCCTKKEELRRLDRLRGISHHSDIEDEKRNLAGMFLSHIGWENDFPVLESPAPFRKR